MIGALACFFLVLPISGRPIEHYKIGGGLLALGVLLWVLTWLANRGLRAKKTYFRDTDDLSGGGPGQLAVAARRGGAVSRRSWRGPGA